MAKLTAAFGTSHSVMLMASEEDWRVGFKEVDPRNPNFYDAKGQPCSYDYLASIAPQGSEAMVTPERMSERYHAAQAAMDHMRDLLEKAPIDVLIVCGDDQLELFRMTNMPAIAIYYGETIRNAKRVVTAGMHWYKYAQAMRQEPDDDVHYPVDAELATYLIRGLSDDCFDITAVNGLEPKQFEGHALSFLHRRYLTKRRIPMVPILLNTFDPPNQPTPKRCEQLGAALRDLIAKYPKDIRVGILASGGLSHFVVEEKLDRAILEALRTKDSAFLRSIDPLRLQAGSSEIRNWIVVAEAARDLKLGWVDYVPGYRTPALTGTGLAFAEWTE